MCGIVLQSTLSRRGAQWDRRGEQAPLHVGSVPSGVTRPQRPDGGAGFSSAEERACHAASTMLMSAGLTSSQVRVLRPPSGLTQIWLG